MGNNYSGIYYLITVLNSYQKPYNNSICPNKYSYAIVTNSFRINVEYIIKYITMVILLTTFNNFWKNS